MAKRTGVTSLRQVAKTLCRLVLDYGEIIKKIYPDNTALHLAIDTADVACHALFVQLDALVEYGD